MPQRASRRNELQVKKYSPRSVVARRGRLGCRIVAILLRSGIAFVAGWLMTRKEEDILLSAVPFPLFLSFLCCKTGFLTLYPTPSLPPSLSALGSRSIVLVHTTPRTPALYNIPDRR